MKVIQGVHRFPTGDTKIVLTLGNFDGVHLGHQALLQKTVSWAEQLQAFAAAMTFCPHPHSILFPQNNRIELMDLEDRQQEFKKWRIDYCVLQSFDKSFADLSAQDFLKLLQEHLNLRGVVVGHDFQFGRGKQGQVEFLRNWASQAGIQFAEVLPVLVDGEEVSSTQIKTLLASSKFEESAKLLGRYYYIRGEVIKGEGRGRKINLATANFVPTVRSPLQNGVYAGWALCQHKRYRALLNIGHKPTFWRDEVYPRTYECHLMDFDSDIYGEILGFEPRLYLREELKFSSVETLLSQVNQDRNQARKLL